MPAFRAATVRKRRDLAAFLPAASEVPFPSGTPLYNVLIPEPQPKVFPRLLLALILFFALDALAFRTGYYATILEPDSTAGYLQGYLWNEKHRAPDQHPQVLAIGDSRMGFKAIVANQLTPETGYTFASIAVPGTTPRCWYYMLREVDPSVNRYAAILIPFDTYDDRISEPIADRELDIRYLTPILRITDLFPFTLSYPTWSGRWQAARAVLFKGLAYQRDFQEFLAHRRTRLQNAATVHRLGAAWVYTAVWERRSLAGMTVDWQTARVTLPDWLDADKRRDIEETILRPPAPVDADFAAYRERWIGAIVDRYRGSRTRLIFLRLPRGPVARPAWPEARVSSIRSLAAQPGALLTDVHAFESLERPELFGDAMHLNEEGGREFSAQIARATPAWIQAASERAR